MKRKSLTPNHKRT